MAQLVFHHEVSAPSGLRRSRPKPNATGFHPMGPFSATLCATEGARLAGGYPSGLFAALMEKLPRPDGLGGQETDMVDYRRQPVHLKPWDQQFYCMADTLTFEGCFGAEIVGIAFFDQAEGGTLVAYGALISSRASRCKAASLEIGAYGLRVKRIAPFAV
jgi:hypothetical protein